MILTSVVVGCTSNGRHASSISHLLPPALAGPPAPASGVQRRCFARLAANRYPIDGQAIPPLLRISCYSPPSVAPPRTRTSQVSHSSPFATQLPRLPHLRVVPVWGGGASPSSTALVRLVRRVQHGQQTRVIGRRLYVERLTAATHEVHGHTQGKCLLIMRKK